MDEDNGRVSWIVADATSYSHQHDQMEWLTTQFDVEMKAFFRGWIVKHWGYLVVMYEYSHPNDVMSQVITKCLNVEIFTLSRLNLV